MAERFIRVFKKLDVHQVREHLLVYGDLSANCGKCQAVNLKLDDRTCPECRTEFQYIAFRNVKDHLPKMLRLNENRPDVLIVDHEDFRRVLGAVKAEEFLK